MTVAFEFEEKKEDDENAGKVKVNLLIFVSSSFSLFLFVHCYYSDRLWDSLTDLARRSDTSSSFTAVLFLKQDVILEARLCFRMRQTS